jgi:hypothetical protein
MKTETALTRCLLAGGNRCFFSERRIDVTIIRRSLWYTFIPKMPKIGASFAKPTSIFTGAYIDKSEHSSKQT